MNDVIDVIKQSSKNNVPILLYYEDFMAFKDGCKQRRKLSTAGGDTNIPLLENVRVAEFRKSSNSLFFKKSYNQENFVESQFLKSKFSLEMAGKLACNRGVNTLKKRKIVEQLCQHMPERKKIF